ncbi:MAG: hypothetical protein CEO12_674 [Parcubacteria group bacterium Gr01-1014_46]|nr:MAG: hypothetical protein CEO12_674 [Parcubacteria group bacterium Gr01-1014_46]
MAIAAVIYSFAVVKPTTEAINKNLAKHFGKIVYIPEGIPPPGRDFNDITYFWEMETPAKEVTPIRFKYHTGFSKNQHILQAILELPEGGDPSIFGKVMPAVIADRRSLESARDPQKANLAANSEAGYSALKLTVNATTSQTVKIIWDFEKGSFDEETLKLYRKLHKLPEPLTRILFTLPSFTISLLGA